MACLDDDRVLAYVDNALSVPERAAAERHMDGCAACRRLISDLARGTDVLNRLTPGTIERIGAALSATVRPDIRPGAPDGAPLPSIPTSAGDLEVRSILGEGGMGRVFLARQLSLRRDVAIKTLLPERHSPEAEAALLSEGRCAGGLEHPNIVPVHALGRDQDGSAVLVMKRLEGTSWHDRIREQDLERNLEILIQVCNAVHFAHDRDVLHRDIKPDNVMLGEFGEVTLVDWGVALRLSEREGASEVAGTPRYMAPEMLDGGLALSPRTDVYLLGATLCEILTGRPPHRGTTLREILSSVSAPEAPALDGSVPEALAQICCRALDPVPQRRFFSAADLRDALVAYLRHRASGRLAEEAIQQLEESRLAESPAVRRRRLAECHFGLKQALREWAENDAAKRGITECVAELARLEIGEGNLGATELLVAELAEPPKDLVEALTALKARQEAEAAGRQRLEAIDRDQDFGLSRRARVLIVSVLLGLKFLTDLYGMIEGRAQTLTPAELAQVTSFHVLSGCVVVAFARRALFKNLINRQLILSILAIGFGLLLYMILSLWRAQPVEETLAEAMVLYGLAFALMAILLVRWLWGVAALTCAAAVVATVHPQATGYLWALTTSLPLIGMLIAWWRPAKQPPAGG